MFAAAWWPADRKLHHVLLSLAGLLLEAKQLVPYLAEKNEGGVGNPTHIIVSKTKKPGNKWLLLKLI